MRPQKLFPNNTADRMKELLISTCSLNEYRRIQSIYLRAKYGYNANQIAEIVGLSPQTVRNLHAAYLKKGEIALKQLTKGGRRHSNLSVAQEDDLLASFEQQGKLGNIVEIGLFHKDYEKALGRAVPNSTIYRLLHRHGWRKLMPRPVHPKHDPLRAQAFKKNSQDYFEKRKNNL